MQKLFLLFLLGGLTTFSFSQSSKKNDCKFDNIVTSDIVVSKYNRNPNKFKYVYTFNNSFNTNNNFGLNVDSYVCNHMSKNYKKIEKSIKPLEDQLKKINAPKIKK